jgi:hypothetical protein
VGRPRKIVVLDLEDEAVSCRERGKSAAATCDYLNGLLEKRGSAERLTEKAVKRYWSSLGEASVAVAHRPDIVERNAEASVDIAQRVRDMLSELDARYEEAKGDTNRFGERQWPAVTALSKQLADVLKLYIEMTEKVENVEKTRAFREAVMQAVGEADPETRGRIQQRFQASRQIIEARFGA